MTSSPREASKARSSTSRATSSERRSAGGEAHATGRAPVRERAPILLIRPPGRRRERGGGVGAARCSSPSRDASGRGCKASVE